MLYCYTNHGIECVATEIKIKQEIARNWFLNK